MTGYFTFREHMLLLPAEHRAFSNKHIYVPHSSLQGLKQSFSQETMSTEIACVQDSLTLTFNQKHISIESRMAHKINAICHKFSVFTEYLNQHILLKLIAQIFQ